MSLHESVATLTQLSDGDLWTSALSTNGERRKATALLLAHLAVIEARELHLLRGYSSMFDFCVRGLGMSEGTAHRAISGTRAARRYPLVLEMLADGRLHLSGLSLLAPASRRKTTRSSWKKPRARRKRAFARFWRAGSRSRTSRTVCSRCRRKASRASGLGRLPGRAAAARRAAFRGALRRALHGKRAPPGQARARAQSDEPREP